MSPHLAAEREGLVVKDSAVLETLGECLEDVVECGAGKERSEVHGSMLMVLISNNYFLLLIKDFLISVFSFKVIV